MIDTTKLVHVRFENTDSVIVDRDIAIDTVCEDPDGLRKLAKAQLLTEDALGLIQINKIILIRPLLPMW